LCAGIGSPALLRDFGIRPPIYPLRGFSLTLPILDRDKVPLTSVTDYARKIVYAPLGNTLRAAGMADIVGYDTRLDPRRIGLLARQVRETFPEGLDHGRADQWCGLRPATPTGLPVIGPSKIRNLILNTGHGALGFTLALGSAALVADHLQGRQPAIDPAPFQLGAAPVRGIGSPLLA
jgi:D-amino-acid dehydrogenase